jgi:hypothetical protein
MYASFLGFCVPYIWTFLNSLFKIEFFNKLLKGPRMSIVSTTGSTYSPADILAQQYAKAGKKKPTFAESVLADIGRTDPQKADALKKKLDDAGQAVDQLRAVKSKIMQSRKKEAAEKVKRLKEQIQMLKVMGGDPRMVARQIAQLSRELAAAAREYASASKDGASSQDNMSAEGAGASTTGNNIALLNAAGGDGGVSGAAAPVIVSAETGSGEAAASGSTDAKDGSTPTGATEAVPAGVTQEGMRQYQEAQRQKLTDDVQKVTGDIKEKTAEAEADRQFAQDVRTVAALLKALARQQEQRLHKAGDHSADYDLKRTSQALAEAEKSVSGTLAPSTNATAVLAVSVIAIG